MASEKARRRVAAPDPERLRDAFFELLELGPDAREEQLERWRDEPELVAELRGMLAVPEEAQALDRGAPAPHEASAQRFREGALVADRYRLLASVGASGGGCVWRAHDALFDDEVAIKFLAEPRDADHAQLENVALRYLRIAGVVDHRDDGRLADGTRYHTTRWLTGEAFPGRPGAHTWRELETRGAELMRIVRTIHAHGVIHGDIKASNVLVLEDGRVTLLDLGAARGRHDDAHGGAAMTLAWAAPELLRGELPTASSDWWAVGVLFHEALTGQRFRDCALADIFSPEELARVPDWSSDVVPPSAGLDASLRDALAMLTAAEAAGRSAAARSLLGELDARRDAGFSTKLGDESTQAELELLFAGPRRIHFLPQDAAQELWARAPERAEDRQKVLHSWLERGLARRDGERLRVERDALDRLVFERMLQHEDAGQLTRALRDRDAEAIAKAALERSATLQHEGRLGPAFELMREALSTLRETRDGEDAILACGREMLGITLSLSSTRKLELCHWTLRDWESSESAALRVLAQLAGLAHDAFTGKFETTLEACRALPLVGEGSDRLSWTVRLFAARYAAPEVFEEEIACFTRWNDSAGAPRNRPLALRARAAIALREARYAESARLHAESLQWASTRRERFSALLDAAWCHIEEFKLEDVERIARRVLRDGVDYREASIHACAEWLARAVRYRRREFCEVDAELVDAARSLRTSTLDGMLLLGEAAFAWRRAERALARELAEESSTRFAAKQRAEALLPRALAAVCGSRQALEAIDAEPAIEAALLDLNPGVAIQICGLLARSEARCAPAMPAVAARLAPRCEELPPDAPAEVLSVRESLRR